jgi:hypothetical protein
MKHRNIFCAGCFFILSAAPLPANDPDVIKIGIVDSLVKDLTPGKRKILDSEFPALMLEFTGLKSELLQGGDPLTAGKYFEDVKWHLGVFQGVDFAWARSKDPKLQPLMIAIGPRREIHAVLVVKKDSPVTGFDDLKGKAVQVLQGREHCRLFAEKGVKGPAKEFFSKVTTTNSGEGALDDVLTGAAQAAFVDTAALESYKEIQPGRFKRLKVLAESERFPSSVIAYREGVLSKDLLEKFKTGMLKANESDRGRDMMADFRITAFEPVPEDYEKQLSSIAKAYPPPSK